MVCQPDRPKGRGLKLTEPAVKVCAQELGLPVFQPLKVRDGELEARLMSLELDLSLVIAYGRILPASLLAVPRLGSLNLHASLLPKYRGAAPIQRALMDGETETGICLMQMDAGMDTGPILTTHRLPIDASDDYGSLSRKLGELAALTTQQDLPRLLAGELNPTTQDAALSSHAPPIDKAEGRLRLAEESAEQIWGKVRGLTPSPGAYVELPLVPPRRLRITRASIDPLRTLPPGQVQIESGRIWIGTKTAALEVLTAQPEGKNPMSARDLENGRVLSSGMRLGLAHASSP